jgi:hypothetical protein
MLRLAWWRWKVKRNSAASRWRSRLLLVGLAAAAANLTLRFCNGLYEASIVHRDVITTLWFVQVLGLILCIWSFLAAVIGEGGGRILLALVTFIGIALWLVFTGPVFL